MDRDTRQHLAPPIARWLGAAIGIGLKPQNAGADDDDEE